MSQAPETVESLKRERDAYARALADSNKLVSEKVKEFSIIKRVGEAALGNPDRKRLVTEVVNIIIDETAAENCSLWLVDEMGIDLVLTAARGQEDPEPRYYEPEDRTVRRFPVGEGAAGWVAKEGESLLIENTGESERFAKSSRSSMSGQIKSLLALPLKSGGVVMGVLNLSHPDIGAFSQEHERVLTLIVQQTGLALANVRLFERISRFNEELEATVTRRTRELAYSESRYRAFHERAGDGIVVVDRQRSKIVEVNRRACELTGRSAEELRAGGLSLLFPPVDEKTLLARLAGGNGSVEGLGLSLAPQEGRERRFVEVSATTIATDVGETLHMILRDVTDRRRLEEQLARYSDGLNELVRRRTEELKMAQDELTHAARMVTIGEIASGMAHEVNNPLAVIAGYAESLAEQVPDESRIDREEIARIVGIIVSQAERCQRITRSVLDFARRQEMRIELVDLTRSLSNALLLAGHKAGEREVTLVADLAPDLPRVITDPHLLEQILLNLLNNAVDAVGAEGKVTLSARIAHGTVRVTVADNGPGVPPELREKIFAPFFTTKPMGEGTGLGLAICRQLAERLQSPLSVEEAPGGGALFVLTMPTDIAAPDTASEVP
ncbi:MAG: GAF domain-containing protein [Nitrospinae bacterium]|nr:GAF domain-containing protein [Nitrospinota bacterium]